MAFAARSQLAELALVDGAVGVVLASGGRLVLAIRCEVEDGLTTAYDVIAWVVSLALLDDG